MRLTEAKTEQEVMANLLDVLGTQVTNTANIKGGRRLYRSLAQRNADIARMPLGECVSRAFAKMPRRDINLFDAETPRDQIDQLETMDRMLKLLKVSGPKLDEKGKEVLDKSGNVAVPDLRKDFINRAGKALLSKNEVEINKIYDDLDEQVKQSMLRFGTHKNIVDELYKSFSEYKEDTLLFDLDELGQKTDEGFFRKVHGIEDGGDDMSVVGPMTTGELAKRHFFIPDPRQVRRLTNKMNGIWVKKDPNLKNLAEAGQLKPPLAFINYIQEEIWRPLITLTGGNFFIKSEMRLHTRFTNSKRKNKHKLLSTGIKLRFSENCALK
jgi:hypothetical protein